MAEGIPYVLNENAFLSTSNDLNDLNAVSGAVVFDNITAVS